MAFGMLGQHPNTDPQTQPKPCLLSLFKTLVAILCSFCVISFILLFFLNKREVFLKNDKK